jgi:mono/diheme cytochrome c family protein
MLKKILLSTVAVILLAIVSVFIYVSQTWDKKYNDWPAPTLKSSTDSAVIARGRYLVTGPAHCNSCHVSSIQDMEDSDKGLPIPLKGGVGLPMGPLGKIFARNLTPEKNTGIGRYTDEQIFRMMRHGIRPDGTASMPLLMPFWKMADDDLVAVVSYLRSLEPVENIVPENQWTFVGKAVRSLTSTFKPIENPDAPKIAPPMLPPSLERGQYLALNVTNCVACHTPRDITTFEATGPEFSGGMEFEPWPELHKHFNIDTTLWLRTPNITPHPGGVFAKYKTPEDFIARFRQGRTIPVSPMDWGPFSRISDEDLTSIWMFLNSLAPVEHEVGDITFKKEGE